MINVSKMLEISRISLSKKIALTRKDYEFITAFGEALKIPKGQQYLLLMHFLNCYKLQKKPKRRK